jgi:hypothetical protein
MRVLRALPVTRAVRVSASMSDHVRVAGDMGEDPVGQLAKCVMPACSKGRSFVSKSAGQSGLAEGQVRQSPRSRLEVVARASSGRM